MKNYSVNRFASIFAKETQLLETRIKSRTSDIFFRSSRKYDKRPPHLLIDESLRRLTSDGWEMDFIRTEYEAAREFYGIMLFSRKLVFVRHTAGLAILPIASVEKISVSRKREFAAHYCILSVFYTNGKSEDFDFICSNDTIIFAKPFLSPDKFQNELEYVFRRASLAAADSAGYNDADVDITIDGDCSLLIKDIAGKERELAMKELSVLKKMFFAATFFSALLFFILCFVMVKNDIPVQIAMQFPILILIYFVFAFVWMYRRKSVLSLTPADAEAKIGNSIMEQAKKIKTSCRELCEAYLSAEILEKTMMLCGNWLIFRRDFEILFVDLNSVIYMYSRTDTTRSGRNSRSAYYLILKHADGLLSFFEIKDSINPFYLGGRHFSILKQALAGCPWIFTGPDDLNEYGSWEKMALKSARKRKAFYDSRSRI